MAKEKSNSKILIGIIVIAVIIFLIVPRKPGVREWDDFATCLSENGAAMYGTDWCSHCQDQKEMFGKSFDKVNFVDCDRSREECLSAGIEGYPTWKVNGNNYPGVQSFQKLASLTGCEAVKDISEVI